MTEARHDEGRDIRALEVDYPNVGETSNAMEDMYEDRIDALVLRGAFPVDFAGELIQRIAAKQDLPWLRPNRTGPSADIRVLGVPATPTFETPGGPAVDDYFKEAVHYDQVNADLFGQSKDGPHYIEELLGTVSGGRPVTRLINSDGQPFAACTVRSLPEGQNIVVHNDYFHFNLPIYAHVKDSLDISMSLSFFAVLQAPESGGELVVHGLTHRETPPALPGGFPDGNAIRERYKFRKFELGTGDVIVFGAGKFYHHVATVEGSTPRVTLGAFMAFDKDRKRVVYWN